MKKIILAGLISDKNLGDKIISDCSKHLFVEETKAYKNIHYEWLDLIYENEISWLLRKFKSGIKRFKHKFGIYNDNKRIQNITEHYSKIIQQSSLIILVGGGLIKYQYQNLWIYIHSLISVAAKYNIPVVFSSVGVEGYSETDKRCIILKKAINNPIVKIITTRDDFNTLDNLYLKNNDKISRFFIPDSAIICSQVYQINKNSKSDIIGIGIIRGKIFKDNNLDFSEVDVIDLYSNIIRELENRKYKYQLFTNGLPVDSELGQKIFNNINKPFTSNCILVPKNPKELVQIIASFKGVIAARLHACIVSYSLEIPVVGIVWNEKLSMFGNNIGYPSRFITNDNLGAKQLLDQLEVAIAEGYNMNKKNIEVKALKESAHYILKSTNIIEK